MVIGVALLVGLSCPQMLANLFDLSFSFYNHVQSIKWSFTGLEPIERSPASFSIKSFERCHLDASLVAIVVGELRKWQEFLPPFSIGQHTSAQHILKNLIHSLSLASGLRMVGGTMQEGCSHCLMQTLPK